MERTSYYLPWQMTITLLNYHGRASRKTISSTYNPFTLAFILDRLTETRPDRVLMDNFSPAQYERFEAYRRHALPKQAVRKVLSPSLLFLAILSNEQPDRLSSSH